MNNINMIKWLTSVLLILNTGILVAQVPDSDGDGVPDSEDVCPMVKGTKSNKGCPDAAAGTNKQYPVYYSTDGKGSFIAMLILTNQMSEFNNAVEFVQQQLLINSASCLMKQLNKGLKPFWLITSHQNPPPLFPSSDDSDK